MVGEGPKRVGAGPKREGEGPKREGEGPKREGEAPKLEREGSLGGPSREGPTPDLVVKDRSGIFTPRARGLPRVHARAGPSDRSRALVFLQLCSRV